MEVFHAGSPWGRVATSESSCHKWRGQGHGALCWLCGTEISVLAAGEGSNAYGHARAMRTPLMTSRDSPTPRETQRRTTCTPAAARPRRRVRPGPGSRMVNEKSKPQTYTVSKSTVNFGCAFYCARNYRLTAPPSGLSPVSRASRAL